MSRRTSIAKAISASGLSIYDSLQERPDLYIGTADLEAILNQGLKGLALDQPLRTRSKVLKSRVCSLLGYPTPPAFRRTRPRFPGQNFDTYVQKADNLQIWNEEVSSSRRYVLVRVNEQDLVTRVRVVTGDVIALLDTTGTLTHKYQAKRKGSATGSCLASSSDTPHIAELLRSGHLAPPDFLPIAVLYSKLLGIVGQTIINPGVTQERNRGGSLHQAVCRALGDPLSSDDGRFPDIKPQLLEIKLQLARTVDLGLVRPDLSETVDGLPMFRNCDVRYAVYYGSLVPGGVQLKQLVLSTGADFFTVFTLFGGLVQNKKYQIPLPKTFFL